MARESRQEYRRRKQKQQQLNATKAMIFQNLDVRTTKNLLKNVSR